MNKLILIGGGIAGIVALVKLASGESPTPAANITAISLTTDKSTCSGTCLVTATVKWKNTGDVAGTFHPTVRAGAFMSQNAAVTLAPDEEVIRQFQFNLSQTTELCPEPN